MLVAVSVVMLGQWKRGGGERERERERERGVVQLFNFNFICLKNKLGCEPMYC